MEKSFKILSLEEIIALNRKLADEDSECLYIESDGNLPQEGSLKTALDEITNTFFGVDRFPEIHQKAAVLCWRIIKGHVFHDLNKRTGTLSLLSILKKNGFMLSLSDSELKQISHSIAEGDTSQESFITWVKEHITPFKESEFNSSKFSSLI